MKILHKLRNIVLGWFVSQQNQKINDEWNRAVKQDLPKFRSIYEPDPIFDEKETKK